MIEEAEALIGVLLAENAALAALDYAAAAAVLPAKQGAAEAWLRARAGLRALTPERWAAARATLRRLESEGARNRDLLARAVRIQGRVVATLAREAAPPRSTYGRTPSDGARGVAGAVPMALSFRT